MRVWLSFCDAMKPKGQQFLGVSIVEVPDVFAGDSRAWLRAASQEAWGRGCNPGGEMVGVPVPDDAEVHPSWMNVLITDRGLLETPGQAGRDLFASPRP